MMLRREVRNVKGKLFNPVAEGYASLGRENLHEPSLLNAEQTSCALKACQGNAKQVETQARQKNQKTFR